MIRPLQRGDCARVADIHVAARPGDVLPDLGRSFLTTLYTALFHSPDVSAFVYQERSHVLGFVVGCLSSSRAMKAVLRQAWFLLCLKTLVRCIRYPRLLPLALETLLYPKRNPLSGPELLAIAVHPHAQGRGIGTQLVEALGRSFRAHGFSHYSVAVKAKNTQATRFYGRRGFQVIQQLHMYDESWDVYECTLTHETPAVSLSSVPARQ